MPSSLARCLVYLQSAQLLGHGLFPSEDRLSEQSIVFLNSVYVYLETVPPLWTTCSSSIAVVTSYIAFRQMLALELGR